MSKNYHRPVSKTWYMENSAYRWFMIRELTAVFVAVYLLFFICTLSQMGKGYEAFQGFLAQLKSGPSVLLHIIALLFAGYHSITWFNLTPKAMPVRMGEKKVPDILIALGGGYVPWIFITLIIWCIALR
jgi:fumarate reductase subunit C